MGMELKEHREVRRRYSNDMEGYTQEKQETEQNRGRRSRYMIITVNRKNYNQYLRDRSISMDWKERDFVSQIKDYIDSSLKKVLLISGLRGTGKTVGLLQAMEHNNALYILPTADRRNEFSNAKEIIDCIADSTENVIMIDEYSWIVDREKYHLDRYLDSLVNSGKRVIVTGTESLCIEALKAGELIHRAITIQTNHISFEEYCRLYDLEMNKRNNRQFLFRGGIFEDYVINNELTMQNYIEESIIKNLRAYITGVLKQKIDEGKIGTLIYTLFYRAIWSIVHDDIKFYSDSMETLSAMDRLGIDADMKKINPHELEMIADVLEQAGVIIKVRNLFPRENKLNEYHLDTDYKTYIVNSSLTWQLLRTLFPEYRDEDGLIGILFEASCMVDLYYKKQKADDIYFIENNDNGKNFEIDIAIVQNNDTPKKRFYLFECKADAKINIHGKAWSILAGNVDRRIMNVWPDSEIVKKTIVHPGDDDILNSDLGEKIFVVNVNKDLFKYYE